MDLRFANPWWLLLLLAAPPLVWLGLRWLRSMSRVRAVASVAFRTIVIALCAAMLAGAASYKRTDRLCVVVVADVSDSVRRLADFGQDTAGQRENPLAGMRQWIARASASMSPDDMLGVVAFDAGALAVAAPRAGGWEEGNIPLDVRVGEGTDIEAALRLARALVPSDAAGRIVLISDGAQTEGDALRALGGDGPGAPVDVVPIVYSARNETLIEFLDAPPRAPRDTTITVRIGLRATRPTTGTLYLQREGRPVPIGADGAFGRRVALTDGLNVVTAQVPLGDEPLHRFEAIFEPDDAASDVILENNRAEAFTVAPGAGAVLVLDGVSEGADDGAGLTLANTLRRSGLDVRVMAPLEAPTDLLSLQAYDLVILENVPAEDLPRPTQDLLPDYVSRLGGGLIMTGGPDSFGPGGWKGSPIEPILPVALDIPEEMIVPSAAIVLVLDSSGSMGRTVLGGARTQQQIANESAAIAIMLLDQQDLIGVIAFDSMTDVVVPIRQNIDPQSTADMVRSIAPGGGTNLYPALRSAGRMLQDVQAQVRHVIVLSDGQSEGSPLDGVQIAEDLAAQGISVTTIAVGDGADLETLRAIAQAGRGTHYRVIDPNLLPRIFIKEVRIFREPLIREQRFTPVVEGVSPLRDAIPSGMPPLDGLVLTELRSEPGVIETLRAPDGPPVLAHWQVGLGRVGAFTSDAHNWARAWLSWPGYTQMWTRLARTISRSGVDSSMEFSTELNGDELTLRLEASDTDGQPLDLLDVDGLLYAPSGKRSEVRLTQVAPGAYEATVRAPESGAYIAAMTPHRGAQALAPVVGGIAKPSSPEHRRLRSDVAALEAIAMQSGGRLLDLSDPESADLFNRSTLQPVYASVPMWRLLLLWCLGALLLDIACRRIAWDRLFGAEFRAAVASMDIEREVRRSYAAARTLGELRSRKSAIAPPTNGSPGAAPAGRSSVHPAPRPARADGPTKPAQPAQPPKGPESDEGEGSAGLLRAKQRARERFGDAPEGEGDA
jgi:Mg-chelatase subunit ChlD